MLKVDSMNFLTKTRDLAIQLHGKQKYGKHPYIFHLDEVAQLAIEFYLSEYIQVAYLHDTMEDCNVTFEFIESTLNKEAAEVIFAVSGFGNNRAEKKLDILQKLEKHPKAITLKMLDRLANMRYSEKTNTKLFKMYLNELDDYMPLFKKGDPNLYQEFEKLQQKYLFINKPKAKI